MRRAGFPVLAAALAAAPPGSPAGACGEQPAAARPLVQQPSAQTIEVTASRRGFRPKSLALRRGQTVHVVLTSADGEHCFAIDALRVEKRVVPGKPTRFDLVPDREGVFPYYCCLETGEAAQLERGQLTVSE